MTVSGRDIDLHLLACLQVLIEEKHVTRAAERMNMSQPGMSNALNRMRTLFRDPILVRTPQGMTATSRAIELSVTAQQIFQHLEAAIAAQQSFDPATEARDFRIIASDYMSMVFLPAMVARLAREAPMVRLGVNSPNPDRLLSSLQSAESDLALGFFPRAPEGLYASVILEEEMCCIVRDGHPLVQETFDMKTFLEIPHVFYGAPSSMVSALESSIEAVLEKSGMRRQIGLRVPNLLVSPIIVAESDMLAIVPLRLARRHAASLSLKILPFPLAIEVNMSLVWHERTHHDPAHRWFRQVLREIARDIVIATRDTDPVKPQAIG